MHKIERLLSNSGAVSKKTIQRQVLAAKKAFQVLTEYPLRAKSRGGKWNIYRNLRGVMLADEVGMGKTFEAFAVAARLYLHETSSRKNKFRVLIIAAPSIQSKWAWCSPTDQKVAGDNGSRNLCSPNCSETQNCTSIGPNKHDVGVFLDYSKIARRKDDLNYLFSTLYFHRIRSKRDWGRQENRQPGRQAMFIASLNTLPAPIIKKGKSSFRKGKNVKNNKTFPLDDNFFDLIIADEAHIARTGVDESDNAPAQSPAALKKIRAILNHNPLAKLLLLTATPFQNHQGELKRLIELLEYAHSKAGVKNMDSPTVVGLIKEGLNKTKEHYAAVVDVVEKIGTENIHALYETLYESCDIDHDNDPQTCYRPDKLKDKKRRVEGLDDYLRDIIIRNRKEKLKQEIIPVDIVTKEQELLHYLLLRDLVAKGSSDDRAKDSLFVSVSLSALVSSSEAFQQTLKGKTSALRDLCISKFPGKNFFDLKLQALIGLLYELKKQPSAEQKSVITIFCRFRKTVAMIKDALEKNHIPVWTLTGSNSPAERNCTLEKLKGWKGKYGVLLVTQVGNEGLDFDTFSNTVIHYDGHYNPAVIDQQNGRVYRKKNKASDIKIIRLQLQGTYDQRISHIELEKRKLKDFYLGDKKLGELLDLVDEKRYEGKINKEQVRKVLREFMIDLEPREKHLI